MSQVNWEYIVDTIRSEKCVLMLGPEVPVDEQGVPLHEALAEHLGLSNDRSDIVYFNDDEFFLFKDETAKFPTYLNIQKFYNHCRPAAIYEQLAQLPFHLIISLSPDGLLRSVYERHGLPMQYDYYRKYENPKPLRRPTKEEPLLYNLFGSVEDDESMIFTHDDMFEFLFSVAGPNQLPDQIKSEVRGAKNFILLGFKFDKWYVKLVLRLFSLHAGRFLRYAPEGRHALEAPTKEWYEHLFKINFVEENLSQFVQELHRRCGQEGMLKPFGEQAQQVSFADRMRAMIQSGDIDKALDEINAYLEANGPEDLLNDLTLTASSYRRIKRRQSSGTIHSDDAEVKTNQVVSALLDIIEEIKEAEAGSPIG